MIVDLHPALAAAPFKPERVPESMTRRFRWDFYRATTRVCEDHHARIDVMKLPEHLKVDHDAPDGHEVYIGKCQGCGGMMFRAFPKLPGVTP